MTTTPESAHLLDELEMICRQRRAVLGKLLAAKRLCPLMNCVTCCGRRMRPSPPPAPTAALIPGRSSVARPARRYRSFAQPWQVQPAC
jgi:hypothetical protein